MRANTLPSTGKKVLKIALAGNPNVGKTVIFNSLTGSFQRVGNWPGVTVEKKEGVFKYKGEEALVMDLPGIYGLTAYSVDERIARDFLIKEKPDAVVLIVDSTNFERNFYLLVELIEFEQNLVVALNMMDEAEKNGLKIDHIGLSKYMNIPFVPTVAIRGEGIEKLKETIFKAARNPSKPRFPKYSAPIENTINEIVKLLEKYQQDFQFPKRWVAIKSIERDPEVVSILKEQNSSLWAEIESIMNNLEKELKTDPSTAVSEERYAFIHGLYKEFVKKDSAPQTKRDLTDKLDLIFTNRLLGIPIFLVLMWAIFQFTFTVGGYFADLIDSFFGWLGDTVESVFVGNEMVISLLKDGVIGGVGSVLVFLPNIFLLFLAISFFEGTGYMARAAFVMDKIMHSMGLHGKSFIPMLLGFGCNVPAVMAARTLENEKDRVLTILVNPLMSCSARLPIYILFTSIFFTKNQGLVILSLYLLGIVLAVLMANLFNKLFFKYESAPLIMELPPYRIPRASMVLKDAWLRTSKFLKKAGTIIFAAVLVIWALSYFPIGVEYGSTDSYIGRIGSFIAPMLKPLGFGRWEAASALLLGTLAKEVVVGVFGTIFGEENLKSALSTIFTPLTAYAFMVFSLIYVPCIATIAVIWKEAGRKWGIISVVYLPILAYVTSFIIYNLGRVFGL